MVKSNEPPSPAEWTADLATCSDWAAGLHELDDQPAFDAKADPEVDTVIRLTADRAMIRTPSRRLMVDWRSDPEAYKHLETIPGEGETLHGVISGRYFLFAQIPAIIERTRLDIDTLTVATLSFSATNAATLLDLIDEGRVKHVKLIVSYFFKRQNEKEYNSLVPALRDRGHQVLAMRNHAKLNLMKMSDGTYYTCESSANWRSNKNLETFALTRGQDLHDFYYHWLDSELLRPRTKEETDE